MFTTIPYPGQPGGMATIGRTLYVDTFGFAYSGAGDRVPPATWHRPADGYDDVFAYDLDTGALVGREPNPIVVPRTMPATVMGLSGIAPGADGLLYVVDMNGRVLRVDPRTGRQEVYATFPTGAGGPFTTMPLDVAFDSRGYGYVTDIGGSPIIWRVPPGGGEAEAWFVDPRIGGFWSEGDGGIRIDPAGRRLYFAVVGSSFAGTAGHGLVYSLPLDRPEDSQLRLVHAYESPAEAPPLGTGPVGLVFGASGKLYVVLPGTGQVSVLRPDGTEERRFEVAGAPNFAAFDGRGGLLVSSLGDESPKSWIVWDVFVHDVDRSQVRSRPPRSDRVRRHAVRSRHARRARRARTS
ncbi:MAG: SMP-30/gluconolactonase/LRE family protein [Gaiellaceae bacterium]